MSNRRAASGQGCSMRPGTFDDTKEVKAGVRQLYQSALTQAPQDKVFLIFIDVNLPTDTLPPPEEPTHSIPYDNIPWMVEIETMLKDDWAIEGRDKTPETAVIITNFAPHFGEKPRRRTSLQSCRLRSRATRLSILM